MAARWVTTGTLLASGLVGCASIVGIKDLDGGTDGTGSVTSSSSGATTGSSSGRPSGSSSGVTTGSSSGGACTPPSGAVCGTDPQCGCPAGEKCDISSDTAICITAGTGTVGTLCTSDTVCAAGLTCVQGVCRPFCTAAQVGTQCTWNGEALGTCIQINDSTGVAVPQDAVCLLACSPVPNNCPAGESCEIITATATDTSFSDCEAAGSTAIGGTCSLTELNCVAGAECVAFQTGDFCAQLCRSGVAGDCASGATCEVGTPATTVDGVAYGACAVP
jgi:hypothetical protein